MTKFKTSALVAALLLTGSAQAAPFNDVVGRPAPPEAVSPAPFNSLMNDRSAVATDPGAAPRHMRRRMRHRGGADIEIAPADQ